MTEAEIKKNIEAQNKRGIENILKRKNREDVYRFRKTKTHPNMCR
jgi:hypothetical protein